MGSDVWKDPYDSHQILICLDKNVKPEESIQKMSQMFKYVFMFDSYQCTGYEFTPKRDNNRYCAAIGECALTWDG